MASIESRIDTFIAEHEIDPLMKDDICALVTGCMEDLFKHVFNQPLPETETKTKAKKVLKADKVEDPATCETFEELRNCTTGVLNQFCKDKGLKMGGTKKDIMDRVWRHIQGESSDEDKSTRGKGKATKVVPEKHACSGTNSSGTACGSSGTEEAGGCYFCWRHITDAQKFVDAMADSKPVVAPAKPKSAKVAKAPAPAKPAAKAAKVVKTPEPVAPAVPSLPSGGRRKPVVPVPEPEPEPESELEEEAFDDELVFEDEEQQETDEDA
jgi:hypothetical protein